jgi:multidrug transporter EmrE-like cation transporter
VNYLPLLLYCTAYASLNVFGAALIKRELLFVKLVSVMDYAGFVIRPLVIAGFFIIFLASLTLFKALSMFKFSLVSPVATGINIGITILIGIFFFEERLTWLQFFGLILIIVGITVITIGKQQ